MWIDAGVELRKLPGGEQTLAVYRERFTFTFYHVFMAWKRSPIGYTTETYAVKDKDERLGFAHCDIKRYLEDKSRLKDDLAAKD